MTPFNEEGSENLSKALLMVTRALVRIIVLMLLATVTIISVNYIGPDHVYAFFKRSNQQEQTSAMAEAKGERKPEVIADLWKAPDIATTEDEAVKYGRELIANTSLYLGPKGKVAALTNGMNCQNCHLDAGTRPFGNNYSAVASTYPKVRARSGMEENIEKRVNDCMERSLNGKTLADDSREMKAIVAYMKWLGTGVAKGEKPKGVGLVELPFMERAADPVSGEALFALKCKSCHGANGEGLPNGEGTAYTYPPLWGEHSYNIGAGLFRLSRFAGYIKANMPLGATYNAPQLTDEEAWDIAAFVNSRPRPSKDLKKDWPDIAKKPVDHPFGPYSDSFSEMQHKFGPFGPVKKEADLLKKKENQKAS